MGNIPPKLNARLRERRESSPRETTSPYSRPPRRTSRSRSASPSTHRALPSHLPDSEGDLSTISGPQVQLASQPSPKSLDLSAIPTAPKSPDTDSSESPHPESSRFYPLTALPSQIVPEEPLLPPEHPFSLISTCPPDVVTVFRYLPPSKHVLLVGPGRSVVQRYEEKYNLRIRIPMQGSDQSCISIRGYADSIARFLVDSQLNVLQGAKWHSEPLHVWGLGIRYNDFPKIHTKPFKTTIETRFNCAFSVPKINGPVKTLNEDGSDLSSSSTSASSNFLPRLLSTQLTAASGAVPRLVARRLASTGVPRGVAAKLVSSLAGQVGETIRTLRQRGSGAGSGSGGKAKLKENVCAGTRTETTATASVGTAAGVGDVEHGVDIDSARSGSASIEGGGGAEDEKELLDRHVSGFGKKNTNSEPQLNSQKLVGKTTNNKAVSRNSLFPGDLGGESGSLFTTADGIVAGYDGGGDNMHGRNEDNDRASSARTPPSILPIFNKGAKRDVDGNGNGGGLRGGSEGGGIAQSKDDRGKDTGHPGKHVSQMAPTQPHTKQKHVQQLMEEGKEGVHDTVHGSGKKKASQGNPQIPRKQENPNPNVTHVQEPQNTVQKGEKQGQEHTQQGSGKSTKNKDKTVESIKNEKNKKKTRENTKSEKQHQRQSGKNMQKKEKHTACQKGDKKLTKSEKIEKKRKEMEPTAGDAPVSKRQKSGNGGQQEKHKQSGKGSQKEKQQAWKKQKNAGIANTSDRFDQGTNSGQSRHPGPLSHSHTGDRKAPRTQTQQPRSHPLQRSHSHKGDLIRHPSEKHGDRKTIGEQEKNGFSLENRFRRDLACARAGDLVERDIVTVTCDNNTIESIRTYLQEELGYPIDVVRDVYLLDEKYQGSDLVYWWGPQDIPGRDPNVLNPIIDVAFFPDPAEGVPPHVSPTEVKYMSAYRKFQHYLLSAKRCIDIAIYNFTDDRTCHVLEQLHEQGIRIRIVTEKSNLGDKGSDIQTLANAGIQTKYDVSKYLMHHKFAIIDGVFVLNGSFNWSRAASSGNQENIVFCNIPEMVRPFIKQFELLWKHGRVIKDDWEERRNKPKER